MQQAAANPVPIDVLVAGAGAVGLAVAVALKSALEEAVEVEIWTGPASPAPAQRVSALAPASRLMLGAIGAWDRLSEEAQPILAMEIGEAQDGEALHPVNLRFEARGEEALAYMASNRTLEEVLLQRAAALGVRISAESARDVRQDSDAAEVTARSGARARARLLVVAEGARSPLRAALGLSCVGWSYRAAAFVRTLAHEAAHEGVARQYFFREGPLAMLPLQGRVSSLVWTLPEGESDRLARAGELEFMRRLQEAFGPALGELRPLDQPLRFPLHYQQARRIIAPRAALIGDAAHVIHPLAGQGLNLGLRDVAALTEAVVEEARLGLDPGSPRALAAYERMRRFDTAALGFATDALHRLFAPDATPTRIARQWGMNFVDASATLKRALAREAAGFGGRPPKLLLGEPV